MNCDDIIDNNFTVEEIEGEPTKVEVDSQLNTNEAEGIDGLQSEHLKHGGPLLTLWLNSSSTSLPAGVSSTISPSRYHLSNL